METAFTTILVIIAALAAGTLLVHAFWRVRSILKVWRAGDPPLHSIRNAIWEQRDVAHLDLAAGPGGANGTPAPPFTFVEEHLTGSQPCMSVRDARGRTWRVKWGDEVQVETLATRLAWAAGYFVEITYYLASGRIDGVGALQRTIPQLDAEGRFTDARFELDEAGVIKHFDEHSWAWNDNPFVGTHELNGLKIVMMWLSNWDAKDVRDVARGSNTAIFEYRRPDGLREARYLIIDWGGALGKWGNIVRRGRWDYEGFAAESDAFIQGVNGDLVNFGYTGQRTADIAMGIRVTDVQWLMKTLDALSEPQIAAAVAAAGGTAEEIDAFTRALRTRLDRLAAVAANPAAVLPGLRVEAAL